MSELSLVLSEKFAQDDAISIAIARSRSWLHAQSAATRRVAQRAHVDAEFRGQRLKGPQPVGVFAGRQCPSLG